MSLQHPVTRTIQGAAGPLNVYIEGDDSAPAVVTTHSLLSSSMMWQPQAAALLSRGFRVVRIDLRGHGMSPASAAPYTMDDLVADTLAVLDALRISRAHYVGSSIGAMSGLGLGISHGDRLLSLCLCAVRADTPPAVHALWDERIAVARTHASCAPLAWPTIERWFGKPFLEANPAVAEEFVRAASMTSVDGFIGCAQAIQNLRCLAEVHRIKTPTTLIVGTNDGVLPQAMHELQALISGSVLEEIEGAGHLPNVDRPEAFHAAMTRHFDRLSAASR